MHRNPAMTGWGTGMKHKKVEQKVLSPAFGLPAKWHMVIAATLVYVSGSIFADTLENRRSELIERISAVLPDRWHAEVVINPEKPWWMEYGDGEFTEVRLTGPNLWGYRLH